MLPRIFESQKWWHLRGDDVRLGILCYWMANSQDRYIRIDSKPKLVKRGAFWTSLDSLAARSGVSFQGVRTGLKNLHNAGFLTSEPTNHGRLITITDYDDFNRAENYSGQAGTPQQADQQADAPQAEQQANQQPGQQQTRSKEGKKEEGTKKKQPTAPTDSEESSPPEILDGLPLYQNDKKLCARLTDELLLSWVVAYPGVIARDELAKAHAWEMANPTKRKKDRVRFFTNWLNRAQDKWRSGTPCDSEGGTWDGMQVQGGGK